MTGPVRLLRFDGSSLTLGLLDEPLPAGTDLDAATVTLVGPGADAATRADRRTVAVADLEAAATEVASAVERRPQAARALDELLRRTSLLPTGPGLAAEAAVYSMLLGGPEFADWRTGRPAPQLATADEPLRITRTGDTLDLVLDRPERRNALSARMREELLDGLEVALVDETVSDVRISGAGPVFCSGGDLGEFGLAATDLVAAYEVRVTRAPWASIDRLTERLGGRMTVRIHGAAIGAGIEMAAFAGHVSCAPGTVLRLPELAMGLVPGAGGTVSITRRIGRWRAAWLMLTGTDLDAATALSWGLVDEVT